VWVCVNAGDLATVRLPVLRWQDSLCTHDQDGMMLERYNTGVLTGDLVTVRLPAFVKQK
jgi:hypothetical protein